MHVGRKNLGFLTNKLLYFLNSTRKRDSYYGSKSYVLYQMVTMSMTMRDPNHSNHPKLQIFRCPFIFGTGQITAYA